VCERKAIEISNAANSPWTRLLEVAAVFTHIKLTVKQSYLSRVKNMTNALIGASNRRTVKDYGAFKQFYSKPSQQQY